MKLDEIKEIIGLAIGEGSMCWSEIPKGIFDSKKASNIINESSLKILNLREKKPLLGLATTRELIDELKARIEIDGKLDYRTVDS
jgi:hypothetical protein